MHPKISTHGPFQMTKGDDWFNIIVVSKDSHEEMIETFMRVIKNYDYVQPLFENVTNSPDSFDSNSIRKLKVWKHPVKELVKDGVILLGESTGFVTQCYYEGFLGNFVGAEIASTVLKDIYNSGRSYNKENLCMYQELVKNKLLKNFHLSQKASEDMFLGNREGQFKIWDAYLKALNKHKQVRKNVWLAWTDNKIPDYDLENDEYCGEKIFFSLPLVWRAKLTPFFLKMKFTKN